MKTSALLLLGVLVGVAWDVHGQPGAIDVGGSGWEFAGDAKAGEFQGRPALQMSNGRALRRDVSLRDGTIEFDVAVTRHRSFVYVQFRIADEGHLEEIYFRPHKSSLPDAVQYSPVDQRSDWQLHHGPGKTAAVELPPDRWIHVRLVLSGDRAALFVGPAATPALVIPLVRPPLAGALAFRAFLPRDVSAEGPIARFANLVARPGYVPEDVPLEVSEPAVPPGIVREWEVSQVFAPPEGPLASPPPGILDGTWRRLAPDRQGLLALNRHVKRPEGVPRPAVLARLRIDSTGETTRRFNFGYSDEVTVFLNGRRVFFADDSYSYDNPRRQGLIGLHQATLFLPLRDGSNELILAVADSFGGWGLIGQLE